MSEEEQEVLPLVAALGKLGIPLENHTQHPKFQALPARCSDPIWDELTAKFGLDDVFELGALKNARFGTLSQAQQAGKD